MRRLSWLLPLPVTLLTLGVTGYRAGDRQLWGDELATWHAVATLDHAEFSRLAGHMDLAVAPYYLMMRAWILGAGDTEAALRAPSILAMAVTAGLIVLLGRRLAGTRVGLIAGLLFAVLPSVSRYAQEARGYAVTMLLAVLATLLLMAAMRRPTWPRWLVYGAAVVLLGFSHVVALSILVPHLIAVRHAAREDDRLRLWRWLGPLVLTVSLAGPFALMVARQSQAISWIRADKAAITALPGQLFGSALMAAAMVGLAVLGIYVSARSTGAQLPLLTGWALFPPVFTLVTFPLLHLFLYRYLLFTIPAWVLLAAIGISAAGERIVPARARGVGAWALASVVVPVIAWLAVPAQLAVRHDPLPGSPDYRGVAEVISADLRPGDAIAFGGRQHRARIGMAYAMRDKLKPRDVFLFETAASVGWYTSRECPVPANCLGSTLRVWLVNTSRSADPFAEMSPLAADLLKDRFTIVEQRDYPNVKLTLLAAE